MPLASSADSDRGTLPTELVYNMASALLSRDGANRACVLRALAVCLARHEANDAQSSDTHWTQSNLSALVQAISRTPQHFDFGELLSLLELRPPVTHSAINQSQMSLAESLAVEAEFTSTPLDFEAAQLSALSAYFWSSCDSEQLWTNLAARPVKCQLVLSADQNELIKQASKYATARLGSLSAFNKRPSTIVSYSYSRSCSHI